MGKFFNSTIALVIILFIDLWVHCQENGLGAIDLNEIYGDWALSPESNENILVYQDEYDLRLYDIVYNTNLNLKFTTYDQTFYLKHYESRKPFRRCGNDTPRSMNRRPSFWKKGIWEVFEEGDKVYLVLKYLMAEKGKEYTLKKMETFQILELEEGKMILKKMESDT